VSCLASRRVALTLSIIRQLRNVNRLVRLVDATAASNTQQTAEFRALDQLITTFRYVPRSRALPARSER